MDTIITIKKRRSIRNYINKSLPDEIIKELIELANLAPSASNAQNRLFFVIRDQKTKRQLFEAAFKQSHLLNAPMIIAVATNTKLYQATEFLKKNQEWGVNLYGAGPKNYQKVKPFLACWKKWVNLWPIQDADASIMTLILAATAKRIGSCWIGLFDHQKVSKILKLPPEFQPVALVTLGYGKLPSYPQSRKAIDGLIRWQI